MPKPIDLDRGVVQRSSQSTGRISMYVDDPGVYYAANGARVSEEVARTAGFDVDEELKKREYNDRLAAAKAKIEAEMGLVDQQVSREMQNEILERTGEGEPRETNARLMDWAGPAVGWRVFDKATSEEVYAGKDKDHAMAALMQCEPGELPEDLTTL